MRVIAICCLLWAGCIPLTMANARTNQLLAEISSTAQLLSASALLCFNPQDPAPDPKILPMVFVYLQILDAHVRELGEPQNLYRPFRATQQVFAELDRLPRSERQSYTVLLRKLLLHQHELQVAVDAAQTELSAALPDEMVSEALHRQSQDMARLLLDYQLRQSPWLERSAWWLDADAQNSLRQDIHKRFEHLSVDLPQHVSELEKVRRQYQFVSAQLNTGKAGSQGGVLFYLSRAVLDLNELAATLAD